MECWEARTYLEYLLDEELDADTRLLLEQHLATCTQCRNILAFQQQMKQFLRSKMRRVPAPASLRQRILTHIDRIEQEERQQPRRPWQRSVTPKIWVPVCIGLLLIGAFLWMAEFSSTPLVLESVQQHMQYITQRPKEGIHSTEATEIREWLSTKLQVAIPVPTIPGLTPLGGWIGTVQGHKVANVLYQDGGQVFSLFIRPEPSLASSFPTNRQEGTRSIYVGRTKGYTAVLWQDKGIFCAFVGNLPEDQVLQYARKAMSG
jgi:mycothiol system anti-sigma-R factor